MTDQEKDLMTSEKPKMTPEQMIVHDTGEYSMLFDTARFNQAWRIAQAFSKSGLVPEHFKDNAAGVFVVLHMATRLALDPFMALQKVYMVHGRPGMEAQLIIALVNARGPFSGPIQWRFEGEGKTRKCTAYATNTKTEELCESEVTWAMVEAEGWNKDSKTRTGDIIKSKWNTLPDLMFRYRSATFLARLYCPEVILGLSTADELEDALIPLESGLTVSPKPKGAISFAPVDTVAVEGFETAVSEKGINDAGKEALEKFVSEIAHVNKQTVEAVKAQAGTPENFPNFWRSFLTWQAKTDKKKPGRPPKAPEPSQDKTSGVIRPDGSYQPHKAAEDTVGPQAITKETIAKIEANCLEKGLDPGMIAEDYQVSDIHELTEADGLKALAFYASRGD